MLNGDRDCDEGETCDDINGNGMISTNIEIERVVGSEETRRVYEVFK